MNKAKTMKTAIAYILVVCIVVSFCSCGKKSSQACVEHKGVGSCKICGLVYFDEFAQIIKSKATSTENGKYTVLVQIDSMDVSIEYDSNDNKILCTLVYLQHQYSPIAFFINIKPTMGTTYGWGMGFADKIVHGTFKAEDLQGLVFRPQIETNDFSQAEFSNINSIYEESVSFCVDMIYSLLAKDNHNNLTIADLGFVNYTPNVTVEMI